MARQITKKQKIFADSYIETGNGTQAAKIAYPDTTYATQRMIASENLTKPNVQEYLQSKAEIAASEVFRIVQHGDSDEVRLKASKDILDRAGFKAVEKSIVAHIRQEPNDRIKELAEKLNK